MKGKLGKKLYATAVVLSVAIAVISCLVGFFLYRDTIEKLYNDNGYVVGQIILDHIDTEKIEEYTKTWTKDEYYDELYSYFEEVVEASGAAYIYLMVPYREGYMRYICDPSGAEFGNTDPMSTSIDEVFKIVDSGEPDRSNYFVRHSKLYGALTSSILPVKASDGTVCALLLVDTHIEIISATLTRYIVVCFAICLFILVIFSLINWKFTKKLLIDPLNLMEEKAKEFADNGAIVTQELASIQTGDELQNLSESILEMEQAIVAYIEDIKTATKEKERIGVELGLASAIQEGSLPKKFPTVTETKGYELYASMDPAKEVGGDFYDFFRIDEDHLGIVMADVSGKGVPASLFMMVSKMLIKNESKFSLDPTVILANVNNQLCEGNEAEMFVTVWMGILKLSTGMLQSANAGHEYPALCRANGSFELVKDKHGMVLGGMEGMKYRMNELTLYPGDCLFLYTDGVPEATSNSEELMGTDRMLEALNLQPSAEPDILIRNVQDGINAFIKDAPQFDDVTMLALRYYGNPGQA